MTYVFRLIPTCMKTKVAQNKTTSINSGHIFQEEDSSLAEKEKVPLLMRPEMSKSSEHKTITITKCQDSRKV